MKGITGAILCGGKSKRMGRPKAGIPLRDGKTLIEKVFHALRPLCENIVLVGHAESVPSALGHLKIIPDLHSNVGPIGGFEALLASDQSDEYLTAPCDALHVQPALFSLLLSKELKAPACLCRRDKEENLLEPAFARLSSKSLSVIREQINAGELSLHELMKALKAQTVEVPSSMFDMLKNANHPEDLRGF